MAEPRIVLKAPATRWLLHGDIAARAAAAPVWGVDFSAQACRAVTRGTRSTLWLGPDEYLLLDTLRDPAPPWQDLEHVLAGTPHALVDVSHRQVALEISGPDAGTLLNSACPLDLDLAQFPVHMCTRTVFAKSEILLWRTAADDFHLEVARSFASYVTALLEEIAQEFRTLG